MTEIDGTSREPGYEVGRRKDGGTAISLTHRHTLDSTTLSDAAQAAQANSMDSELTKVTVAFE